MKPTKAMRMQPPSFALHCYAFKAQVNDEFIIKSRFGSYGHKCMLPLI